MTLTATDIHERAGIVLRLEYSLDRLGAKVPSQSVGRLVRRLEVAERAGLVDSSDPVRLDGWTAIELPRLPPLVADDDEEDRAEVPTASTAAPVEAVDPRHDERTVFLRGLPCDTRDGDVRDLLGDRVAVVEKLNLATTGTGARIGFLRCATVEDGRQLRRWLDARPWRGRVLGAGFAFRR